MVYWVTNGLESPPLNQSGEAGKAGHGIDLPPLRLCLYLPAPDGLMVWFRWPKLFCSTAPISGAP